MTLVSLSKALNHDCFVKVGEVVSALRLLVDDTQAYILTDCKGGNPVSAPGVGGNGPWNKNRLRPGRELFFSKLTGLKLEKTMWRAVVE